MTPHTVQPLSDVCTKTPPLCLPPRHSNVPVSAGKILLRGGRAPQSHTCHPLSAFTGLHTLQPALSLNALGSWVLQSVLKDPLMSPDLSAPVASPVTLWETLWSKPTNGLNSPPPELFSSVPGSSRWVRCTHLLHLLLWPPPLQKQPPALLHATATASSSVFSPLSHGKSNRQTILSSVGCPRGLPIAPSKQVPPGGLQWGSVPRATF